MKTANFVKKLLGMGYTWILDNGHGRLTAGNRSPVLPDGRQFFEYEFNRAIVERLMVLLKAEGIRYVDLVPDYNDVGNFVMGRIARANKVPLPNRCIYLSIHADAAPSNLLNEDGWGDPNGSTVYYSGNSTLKYAKAFSDALATIFRSRGVKVRLNEKGEQYYAVIRETKKMPALILELGFYTNLEEVQKLLDDSFRDQIAQALFNAIKKLDNARVG